MVQPAHAEAGRAAAVGYADVQVGALFQDAAENEGGHEVQVGRATEVVRSLRQLDGVVSADVVTGPIDAIALIEAPNMAAIADLVTGQVQGIRGVLKTITCVTAG